MNVPARTRRSGLNRRLIRVFAIQATLVSVATALGVWAAYAITEQYLVRQALITEADYFLQRRAENPQFPLPETRNMKTWMTSASPEPGVPAVLATLPEDYFGRVDLDGERPLVYTRRLASGNTLILVFKEQQVTRLALLFGVAPLTVVLILIYTASWFTFRQSQALISPVVNLARIIERADVAHSQELRERITALRGEDADVDALANAFLEFLDRLDVFIERERNFSRYASHELRTPLAVLRSSLDLLEQSRQKGQHTDPQANRIAAGMRRTVEDMQALTDTLLQLTRSQEVAAPEKELAPIALRPVFEQLIDTCKASLAPPCPMIELEADGGLEVRLPATALKVVALNLIRNACLHGGDHVHIRVMANGFSVSDNGPGLGEAARRYLGQPFYREHHGKPGHGLGLALVLALCRQQGWRLSLSPPELPGTCFQVDWSG